MNNIPITYQPIQGKTYSLFGKSNTTVEYYQNIEIVANTVLEKYGDIQAVLQTIQHFSPKKRLLKKIAEEIENETTISFIIHLLNKLMSVYTQKVEEHLKNLTIYKYWDRRLSTTRMQYHLYMLEIELINRFFLTNFINADKRIGLLPYCLKDFQVECKAAPNNFDYQCKHCSKNCYQNQVSQILKKNNIDAYIWMGADIKKEVKSCIKNHKTIGIMGIACIPELVMGIRKCQKLKIPVIGLPLDANRCVRWMGEFHENSVNLQMLEQLIGQ